MAVQQEVAREKTQQGLRGGQQILQVWQTILQVARPVLAVGLVLFGLGWGSWVTCCTSVTAREDAIQYGWAQMGLFFNGPDATQVMEWSPGHTVRVGSRALINAPWMEARIQQLNAVLWRGVLWSALFSAVGMSGVWAWLRMRGRRHTQDVRKAGDYIASPEQLKTQIERADQASDLCMGQSALPLIKNTEMQHFLFDGTTGTGKSNAMYALLDQIRARGDRALVWDEGGHFLSRFYDPTRDHLLNDLDARGESWDLWEECRTQAEWESLATAFIPMEGVQDQFWILGARTIFSEVAWRMQQDPQRSAEALLNTLFTARLEDLQRCLAKSYASILVSDKIEKMAISIQSILMTYLKCLRYVKEGTLMVPAFSIRQWVRNESELGWLFCSSVQNHHDALKPLITARLDRAVTELLSRSAAGADRRIWVILDELTSLQRIPTLFTLLAKGRKPGACVVIGTQNVAQLADTYGQHGAPLISSLLNTRFLFRQPDPDMAAWSARNLGEQVVEEVQEGQHYGSEQAGVSLHRRETRKPVVTVSEITTLPDLQCYLRLPGGYPITRLGFTYQERPLRHPCFIPDAEVPPQGLSPLPVVDPAESVELPEVVKPPEKGEPEKPVVWTDWDVLFQCKRE